MSRPPLTDDLLREAEEIARWRLSDPIDVRSAVLEAQNRYYQHTTRDDDGYCYLRRPYKLPILPGTERSLLFLSELCEVLLHPEEWWHFPPPATQEQWIAEYLLVLLNRTMRKWVDPLALAVGCILLGMRPGQVTGITNTTTTPAILGNKKAWLLKELRGHFPDLRTASGRIVGSPADDFQQEKAREFLELFASWRQFLGADPIHFDADAAFELFENNTAYEDPPSKDWNDSTILAKAVAAALERNHVIACSFLYTIWCAPDHWIVPEFIALASGGPTMGASGKHASAASGGQDHTISNGDSMEQYQAELAALRKRRKEFRPPGDRITIDLERAVLPFDPVQHVSRSFVSLSPVPRLKVFGRDPEGEILLAIIPLPDPAEGSTVVERIKLEGGQQIQVKFTRQGSEVPDTNAELQKEILVKALERHEAQDWVLKDEELDSERLEPEEPNVYWNLELSYSETRLDRRLALALRRLRHRWGEPVFAIRRLAAFAAMLIVLAGAGYGASEYGRLLERYADVVAQLGFADPFDVNFSAVEQNSLEVRVELESDIVEEVWVDWGDPAVGGEEKLYPSEEVLEAEERPEVRSQHDYGAVDRGGLRTVASVRIVPRDIPEPRPETLTPDRLNPRRELLVLPVGLILDPPAWRLDFIAPPEDEIVSSVPNIELRVGGVTAPVHLLAREASATGRYRLLATLEEPVFAEERTLKRSVDLSLLGPVGSVDIRAVSAEHLRLDPGGRISPDSLPTDAPEAMIHLILPAAILEPVAGSTVGENETVHFKSNVKGYVAVAIRPVTGGTFWIQNTGRPTTGDAQRIPVIFGAPGDFEVYVGITEEQDLFVRGDTLGQLSDFDQAGKKVNWVGPVVVHREE